ncbi:hypothetical protein, partial [Klebsiella pneumoniae]
VWLQIFADIFQATLEIVDVKDHVHHFQDVAAAERRRIELPTSS